MKTIGFIGCGNMARPIIKSVAEKNVFDKGDIYVYDINKESTALFCRETGVKTALCAEETVRECDIVMLCTKPQTFPELLESISGEIKRSDPLVISIAAGKTTDSVCSLLGFQARVARIFPNLNATVSQAISAYTANARASDEGLEAARLIASSYGEAIELPEELFSAFGVLGGCAPAYTFMFIGALARAGEAHGLDADTSYRAAVQTVLGSAALLKKCGGDIGEWVKKVCSPGGTTVRGVESLTESGLEDAVMRAFDCSYRRDLELNSQ